MLLVIQLKSVKPPTPALFQMLISLWLLSPKSQGTFFLFFSFCNPLQHVYLDVIPFLSLSPSLVWPTLGLFAAEHDLTYNLDTRNFLSLVCARVSPRRTDRTQTKVYHTEAHQAA